VDFSIKKKEFFFTFQLKKIKLLKDKQAHFFFFVNYNIKPYFNITWKIILYCLKKGIPKSCGKNVCILYLFNNLYLSYYKKLLYGSQIVGGEGGVTSLEA